MEFDIELYDYHTVGNILRIEDENSGTSADSYIFAYSYCDEQSSYFKFNIETKESRIADTVANRQLGPGRWWPVRIDFHLDGDSVVMAVAGHRTVTHGLALPEIMKPRLVFGSTKYAEKFAAMAIRDLKVGNGTVMYRFPLDESSGTDVHNLEKKVVGRQDHGVWLINRSYHWKKRLEYISASVAVINFDPVRNDLIIVNKDSLLRYTVYNDRLNAVLLPRPMPIQSKLGTNHYDPEQQQLYVYEVNNMPVDALTAARLDLKNLSWHAMSHKFLATQRHHHVGFYDKPRAKYTIYGGFGNRQYFSEFVSYDLTNDTWQTENFSGDAVPPRFATSLGVLDEDEVLIYGGVGNQTGDESVGVVFYDDLYKVNPEKKHVERLWSRSREGNSLVPVRNLFPTDDDRCFYTLCYPIMEPHSYLKLYKVSVEDGSREQLGDSIAVVSMSILSNINLYRSEDRNELYCVLQEYSDDNRSKIQVYSISTPIVSAAGLTRYEKPNYFILLFAAFATGGVILWIIFAVLRNRRRNERAAECDEPVSLPDVVPSITRNALYLFGEFQIYDRSGRDISYMFSNKIRQLFVLTLIHSGKNSAGIHSCAINEALWGDKDSQSVKNIKGVTMNNLRRILKEIDGIEIIYEDNHFRIGFSDEFYCDYCDYLQLWSRFKAESRMSAEDIGRFTNTVVRGKFLQGFDSECFDTFKSQFEESVVMTLPLQIASAYSGQDYKKTLGLVAALIAVDPYSEIALRYELHTLLRLGHSDQAKKRYYQFKMTYLKHMGEDFKLGFNDLLSESPDAVFI